jgi:hypothetical protein
VAHAAHQRPGPRRACGAELMSHMCRAAHAPPVALFIWRTARARPVTPRACHTLHTKPVGPRICSPCITDLPHRHHTTPPPPLPHPPRAAADLLFRQNDTDAATFHFTALLERRPNNYAAMARLLDLLKRACKIADAGKVLRLAVKANPAAETSDLGYRYCAGVVAQYSNQPAEAIKSLNTVRHSGEHAAGKGGGGGWGG